MRLAPQPRHDRATPSAFNDRAAAVRVPTATLNPWYYEMHEPGFNYRLPDMLCALGISQLAKLERFVARRRALAARYDEALDAARAARASGAAGRRLRSGAASLCRADRLRTRSGSPREQVMARLRARGIGSQVHYIPVHRQPYYRDRYGELALPGADAYYRRELSLPLFPAMSDDDVDARRRCAHRDREAAMTGGWRSSRRAADRNACRARTSCRSAAGRSSRIRSRRHSRAAASRACWSRPRTMRSRKAAREAGAQVHERAAALATDTAARDRRLPRYSCRARSAPGAPTTPLPASMRPRRCGAPTTSPPSSRSIDCRLRLRHGRHDLSRCRRTRPCAWPRTARCRRCGRT